MSQSDTAAPTLDYWLLFRDLPESYLLLRADDPAFTIVELNKTREQLTNVVREDVLGKPFLEVYPDKSKQFRDESIGDIQKQFRDVIRLGKPKRLNVFRYDLADEQGILQSRYWQSTYIPLSLDGTGTITHILARTHDVTDEERAEKHIANVEGRLEAALTIGKVGSWVWNVTDDVVVGDRNLANLFGMSKKLVVRGQAIETFTNMIYPDDRARVRRAIQHAVRDHVPFDEEYRTVTASGKVRWVLARGKVEQQGDTLIFPGVIVDITERRDLQAQIELARRQDQLNRRESKILQKRNEELETISRTKDEFVALASHQLRTPATAVKQYLGMVLQGYVGTITDLQTEMLQRAFESNERQIKIINQILNAARVDTGRLVMVPIPTDLVALLRGITDDMRASVEQRGHTLTMLSPNQDIAVVADQGYLRMAIENLINNAAIYTPEGGHVSVVLELGKDSCTISVTDDGVGIKKADLGKLFSKFSRIHNPLSVQAGGSGIGLYLAAEIVRLHGGTIAVESKIHKGTTFSIRLPLEVASV